MAQRIVLLYMAAENISKPKDEALDKIIYSREHQPFGITWEEWTAKWWQWLLSIPKNSNPGMDITGEKFDPNQENPEVIFMAGTFGGYSERNYSIPSGKAILFPIINFSTSYIEEPALKSESELKSRAKQDIDDILNKEVSIDGIKLQSLENYRIQSEVFDLIYPENNVFDLPQGTSKAISEGYWIFLKPLAPGIHHIYAAGSCSSGKTKVGITWHLDVRE